MTLVERRVEVEPATATPPSRWLLDQLPACMASDPLLRQFVLIFQRLADGYRDRIDGVENVIDPGVAPPDFRHWLTGWLGIAGLDQSASAALQRDLIHATGRSLRNRGTAAGLHALLVAITGEPVRVDDQGGVVHADHVADADVPQGRLVRVEVPSTGTMDQRELVAFVRRELPVHVSLELIVAGQRVFPVLRRRPR